MTATTSTAVVRPATTFSSERKKGGSYTLTTAAVSALAAVDETTTVREVLAILSEVTHASHAVGSASIGKASSVLS